jgi:hypothetical protein
MVQGRLNIEERPSSCNCDPRVTMKMNFGILLVLVAGALLMLGGRARRRSAVDTVPWNYAPSGMDQIGLRGHLRIPPRNASWVR